MDKKKCLDKDMQCIWMAAFRYCLGRRTYMPSLFIYTFLREGIMQAIDTFFIDQMADYIAHAVRHGLAGDDCDVDMWTRFAEKLKIESARRKKENVR